MRPARSSGNTLWGSRGNGSVVVEGRFGSWSCARCVLAVCRVNAPLSREFQLGPSQADIRAFVGTLPRNQNCRRAALSGLRTEAHRDAGIVAERPQWAIRDRDKASGRSHHVGCVPKAEVKSGRWRPPQRTLRVNGVARRMIEGPEPGFECAKDSPTKDIDLES
jgi:hypothetical protein